MTVSARRAIGVDWGGDDKGAAVVVERRADGTVQVLAMKVLGEGTDSVTFEDGIIVERRKGSRVVDVEAVRGARTEGKD